MVALKPFVLLRTDIAISAPFEDDGVGAVYIFKGSQNGINPTYSQRLSPLTFYGNYASLQGFGMGLSGGVDVDGNGYNGKFKTSSSSEHNFFNSSLFLHISFQLFDFRSTFPWVSTNDNNSFIQFFFRYNTIFKFN